MLGRTILIVITMLVVGVNMAGCGFLGINQSNQPTASNYALRTIGGYLAPWNPRGVAALSEGALTEVSPVWYQPEPGGQVTFASQQAKQSQSSIESQATSHNVAIIPSISNYRNGQWDSALIHQIITDPRIRAAHIQAIVDLVSGRPWAGIDIDYESLRTADRAAYSTFISELAAALHQAGKRLTLTVHAKTSEPGDWSGARAQDWKALGASADEVRVMAYDHSTEDSAPGPIAPPDWVSRVLQLAVAEIPRDKIILGVATYGYDWPSGEQGSDLQWADAEALARNHNVSMKWDTASQSPWFTYTGSLGRSHTVWYENALSMKYKLDLATQFRIAGVFIWVLGGEDPAIWGNLRQVS